jgi:small-conductance mechanosensitive channel
MHKEQLICNEILELDNSIRFVGIANKMGKLVAAEFNPGVEVLLTREEIEANAINAVLRMRTREDYEQKLGKTIYTFALYEKVKRASIALYQQDYSLLMISFDVSADHESIILQKILPKIKQHNLIS